MHVLVIGGTRSIGYQLVWRLVAAGHRVSTFNRGRCPDPFGDRVVRLGGDRTAEAFSRLLRGRRFDATVDFAANTAADVRGVAEVLGANAGHYVFISSGQVYLVRQDCPRPAREQDYDGPLLPEPEGPADRAAWRYGVEKRQAEDALVVAWREQGLASTRLRLPMVNGERDPFRRIESYLWRLLDGGPLLIPEDGVQKLRHVYSGDVVNAIVELLGDERTFGEAYNLTQYEAPALVDLVTILAGLLGASPRLVAVTDAELHDDQLTKLLVSPFSDHWMSDMENGKAVVELRFRPESLRHYLDKVVTAFLNHPPKAPPPGYDQRATELALAEEVTRRRTATPATPERTWSEEFALRNPADPDLPSTQDEVRHRRAAGAPAAGHERRGHGAGIGILRLLPGLPAGRARLADPQHRGARRLCAVRPYLGVLVGLT
jgi:nucleoside-diphosphate-sugar epimerase